MLNHCYFICIFSLENAGESSVLSLLRSARLVLGLLCCGRMSSVFSSCSGVNCQVYFVSNPSKLCTKLFTYLHHGFLLVVY